MGGRDGRCGRDGREGLGYRVGCERMAGDGCGGGEDSVEVIWCFLPVAHVGIRFGGWGIIIEGKQCVRCGVRSDCRGCKIVGQGRGGGGSGG